MEAQLHTPLVPNYLLSSSLQQCSPGHATRICASNGCTGSILGGPGQGIAGGLGGPGQGMAGGLSGLGDEKPVAISLIN